VLGRRTSSRQPRARPDLRQCPFLGIEGTNQKDAVDQPEPPACPDYAAFSIAAPLPELASALRFPDTGGARLQRLPLLA
jgi:hypothetical protein